MRFPYRSVGRLLERYHSSIVTRVATHSCVCEIINTIVPTSDQWTSHSGGHLSVFHRIGRAAWSLYVSVTTLT